MARPLRGRTRLFALRWYSFLQRLPDLVLHGACSMHKNAAGMTLAAPRGWLLQAEANRGQGELKPPRSEEHTSELQSRGHLVCRLLLEKKNKKESRYDTDG